MSSHEEFLELCAASTAGELSVDEQARLDAHLAVCPECRSAKSEYEAAAIKGVAALAEEHVPKDHEGIDSWSKEKAEAAAEKYKKEVERYEGDKEDISEKAKDLEKERDLVSRRADRFDGGEGLIEVGLVICSMTLLTKRRLYWFAGILIGAGGVAFALTAFLVH